MVNIAAVKTIGTDFVFGYIQAIDGEKVPFRLCVFDYRICHSELSVCLHYL